MSIIGLIVLWAFISSIINKKPATSTAEKPASPPVSQQQKIDDSMQKIHDQVAQDAIAEFEIAHRGEDKMDACVQAGMVAQAFLQAKNEEKYNHWKKVEKGVCESAGIK